MTGEDARAFALTAGLAVDRETHVYRYQGELLPSVTQILTLVGLNDWSRVPPSILEAARLRGTAVHAAIHYLLEDDLDVDALDPRITPYVLAYDRFRQDTGFVPDTVETPVVHPTYRYAGTPDQCGPWPEGGRAIIDVKTGMESPCVGLQLAGYDLCFAERHRRFALYLDEHGTYRLKECTDAKDRAVFLAAVSLAHWKLRHGG